MSGLASSVLRLVTVWHGDAEDRTLHFSLYHTGSDPVTVATFHMTGGFWLTPKAPVRGARLERTLSNYTMLRPIAATTLASDGVWTFSVGDLNTLPFRAGDGPLSAYVLDGEGTFHTVAVQPLARSLDTNNLEAAVPRKSAPTALPFHGGPTLPVIPFPNLTTVSVAPLADLGPVFVLDAHVPGIIDMALGIDGLAARIGPDSGPIFSRDGKASRRLVIRDGIDHRLGQEGYRLRFTADEVTLDACASAGFRHGLITLAQTVTGARLDSVRYGVPVGGTITDVPRFGWRGIHLDVARTFYSVQEICVLADLAAWLKLNMLHLHLNDDEAWRIGVDGYPEIAEIVAWRGHGLPIPPLLGSGAAPYGGIYTTDDLDRLHTHCGALGITILPEIDIPGHWHAALTALPQLREQGDTDGYASIQGFQANALNPMLSNTLDFVTAAYRTVLEQFSDPAIHIGGDEVAPVTWSGSPLAWAAVSAGQPTGSLQFRLIEPVHDLLTREGRRTVVWEDAIHNARLKPEDTIVLVWQHPDQAHELAARGFDVVLTPGNAYYLDMAYSDVWDSTGGHWAGTVPLKKTYAFEPGLGWPADRLGHLLGVHARIWGEYMQDRRSFDDLVFPRIYAFAERAWIESANRDFSAFRARISAFPTGLDRSGLAD